MSRRPGQRGQTVRKGHMWHIRFYADVPGQDKRQRKSVPIGPCAGSNKLTKSEAARKGAELISSLGVDTAEFFEQAMNITPVVTFKHRVEWCRNYASAWTDGKPGPVRTMESQLSKHVLPRFGDMPLDAVDETAVQEFVADLSEPRLRGGSRTAA